MASILALVEEAVRHCVTHHAGLVMSMPSDNGAPLRNQLPALIFMVLTGVPANDLPICDHLLRPTADIDIVRNHVIRNSRAKLLLASLA